MTLVNNQCNNWGGFKQVCLPQLELCTSQGQVVGRVLQDLRRCEDQILCGALLVFWGEPRPLFRDLAVFRNTHADFFKVVLSMYVFLAVLGLRCCGLLPSGSEQGLPSPVVQASRCRGFSWCGAPALGHLGFSSSGRWVQHLWLLGSVALRHVASSWIGDQNPCLETLRWQVGSSPLSHQGSPVLVFFFFFLIST